MIDQGIDKGKYIKNRKGNQKSFQLEVGFFDLFTGEIQVDKYRNNATIHIDIPSEWLMDRKPKPGLEVQILKKHQGIKQSLKDYWYEMEQVFSIKSLNPTFRKF